MKRWFAVTTLSLAALLSTSAQATATQATATPIQPHAQLHAGLVTVAQARALPLGTAVTVVGEVTTPSGAFESSFFDKGFGLQDLTGGIFVSTQTDYGVGPRRIARITGTLADSFGLLVLVVSDVSFGPNGLPVLAEPHRTAGIGEGTEGRIVRVSGRISTAPSSDLSFGFKFGVDDGSGEVQIFVNLQTGIDVSTLRLGQRVTITGFSSQFDTHYEIDPRSPADIVTR